MNTDTTYRQTTLSLIMAVLLCMFTIAPASAEVITYEYDNAGQVTRAIYGNGATMEYTYDGSGNRLTYQTYASSDITPDQFTFDSQSNVALNTLVESNAITVTGINTPATLSITNGEYAVSTDGGTTWSSFSTSSPATISANSMIKVRQMSAGASATTTVTTLTIGGVSSTFSVTTVELTPPISTILTPENGTGTMNTFFTVSGTASDVGSSVNKVEISINGGNWIQVTGTTNWTYQWTGITPGNYTVQSRATDSSGNVETPVAGITVHVYTDTPSAVGINGRSLTVNSQPFMIRGINYSPVPIGEDPYSSPYGDYFTSAYSAIYDRDLALIRQMGANTIRIWVWDAAADHSDFLDQAYSGTSPIFVIAGYNINAGYDLSNQTIRNSIKADFRAMVAAHKTHPAILMWAIGNDLNSDVMYGGDKANLMSLVNEMAAEAHAEEGAAYHPVTMPLADSDLINTISTYNASMSNLDIWSANVYRGSSFGTLFTDYAAVSSKPFAITEYGADAYDSVNGDEYEDIGIPYQAEYAEALWGEIQTNAATCIGGSIMSYSDEWWKGIYGSGTGCPDSSLDVQSVCGFADASQPDGYSNEEWWGIMRILDNGTGPDVMEPRAVYYALQALWAGAGTIPVISSDVSLLSYGSQNVGQTSAVKTVTISNTGMENLEIGAISLTGNNPEDFTVQSNTCSGRIKVPQDNCVIGIVFLPVGLGVRTANLAVASNDPVRSTLTISLQGTSIDTLPPTGSIAINSGAATTQSTSATLTLTASDPDGLPIQMCISNTTSCTAWEAFATTKAWTLTTGDGTKTVSVWLKDAMSNTTATAYTDTIILDATRPVNGTLTATPGAGQITLSWTGFSDATSGIASYKVVYAPTTAPASCSTGTELYSGGLNTTYIHTGLTNQVYGYRVCAIDNAGNVSTGATQTATPLPSETNPPIGSIVINNGAAWTNSTAVTLALTATDDSPPIKMCISNTTSCTAWQNFASTKSWTLTTGDGTKTVYALFRDVWNNTTATAYTDTIGLDTTKPVNGTLTATPGTGQITLNWSGFSDVSSGIASYKVTYSTSSFPSCTSSYVVYSGGLDTTYTHTGLNRNNTYYYRACAIDNAGNMSTGATSSARPL